MLNGSTIGGNCLGSRREAHRNGLVSLYVTIFLDPLDQGSAGITPARYPLPGKGLCLHTARPVNKDRPSLAAFLGQSTIGGTCFEHPLYKDPISPGVALEKEV